MLIFFTYASFPFNARSHRSHRSHTFFVFVEIFFCFQPFVLTWDLWDRGTHTDRSALGSPSFVFRSFSAKKTGRRSIPFPRISHAPGTCFRFSDLRSPVPDFNRGFSRNRNFVFRILHSAFSVPISRARDAARRFSAGLRAYPSRSASCRNSSYTPSITR